VHALHAKGFEIDKRKIQLAEPIKTLGDSSVPLRIHREVVAQLRVRVVPATQ
jgi:large subunit ribosomal protein L9